MSYIICVRYSHLYPVFLLHSELERGGSISDSFLEDCIDLVLRSPERVFLLLFDGNPYFFAKSLYWAMLCCSPEPTQISTAVEATVDVWSSILRAFIS